MYIIFIIIIIIIVVDYLYKHLFGAKLEIISFKQVSSRGSYDIYIAKAIGRKMGNNTYRLKEADNYSRIALTIEEVDMRRTGSHRKVLIKNNQEIEFYIMMKNTVEYYNIGLEKVKS